MTELTMFFFQPFPGHMCAPIPILEKLKVSTTLSSNLLPPGPLVLQIYKGNLVTKIKGNNSQKKIIIFLQTEPNGNQRETKKLDDYLCSY